MNERFFAACNSAEYSCYSRSNCYGSSDKIQIVECSCIFIELIRDTHGRSVCMCPTKLLSEIASEFMELHSAFVDVGTIKV